MRKFRSYFTKCNTLIKDSEVNTSQNPVTEIIYGGENKKITRFIFSVDFSKLIDRINSGYINKDDIVSHKLHMTNTINYLPKYIGKKTYTKNIDRASSFILELFNVEEDWDEGSGYDFVLSTEIPLKNINTSPSNWYYKKTNIPWLNEGVLGVSNGTTETIGTQPFEKGNENLEIDITDFVDDLLYYSETTISAGIKHNNDLEVLKTPNPQSVGFHTKHTHTFFQPYIETIIDDEISDDRHYFYLDKENDLYFTLFDFTNADLNEVSIENVQIFDYQDNLYKTIEPDSIINCGYGAFKIKLKIKSDDFPDSVLFRDVWNIKINDKILTHEDSFYLMSPKCYYFPDRVDTKLSNFHFLCWGLNQGEKIKRGEIRRVKLSIKELYATRDNLMPHNIEYRIYTKIDSNNEIDIIPFTSVNRTKTSYEFFIDTEWLIENDYYIDIRLKNSYQTETKETISFKVI